MKHIDNGSRQEKENIEREIRRIKGWHRIRELLGIRPFSNDFRIKGAEAAKLEDMIQKGKLEKLIKSNKIEPLWRVGFLHDIDGHVPRIGSMEIYEINKSEDKNIYAVKTSDEPLLNDLAVLNLQIDNKEAPYMDKRSSLIVLTGKMPPKESVRGIQVADFILRNIKVIKENQFDIGEIKAGESSGIPLVEELNIEKDGSLSRKKSQGEINILEIASREKVQGEKYNAYEAETTKTLREILKESGRLHPNSSRYAARRKYIEECLPEK